MQRENETLRLTVMSKKKKKKVWWIKDRNWVLASYGNKRIFSGLSKTITSTSGEIRVTIPESTILSSINSKTTSQFRVYDNSPKTIFNFRNKSSEFFPPWRSGSNLFITSIIFWDKDFMRTLSFCKKKIP